MKIIKYQFKLMILVALWLSSASLFAFQELPTNPGLHIGKLENGLTYYLEENATPKNHIEFRLVVKAGSILEDDDQQGLAHFIEHMAFNGTKHFEKNSLIDFLQKMGVEFGADLNAYTGFDETVYMLSIPTDNPENVDQALTVLSDWAHEITFAREEIDKERGVIMEEWRTSLGAEERMRKKTWPIILAGSRYAERLPIGKPKIIQSCNYDLLNRFYRDWYRPDLMGVVAVGDFNRADMEKYIKKYFGKIKSPETSRKRVYYAPADFKGTRVAIASDKEATENVIGVEFIRPGTFPAKNTLEWFRKAIVGDLYSFMMGQRLGELTLSEDPPFLYSYSYYDRTMLGKDKYAYNIAVGVKNDQFERGLEAVMAAHEQVRRFGFTPGELERVKALYLNEYERAVKEDDKSKSAGIAEAYMSHFLNGGTLLSAPQGLKYINQLLPSIELDEVNALTKDFWGRSDNRTIQVSAKAADADKIPAKQALIDVLDNISNDQSVKAYEDAKIDAPLMSSMPGPGSIIKESSDEKTGIVSMTLSNGAKVYLKPTDFKNDEVNMTASSFGGMSLYRPDELTSVRHAADIVNTMGIGPFNAIDLDKFMSGKTASVQPVIDLYGESVSGFSSLKDLETFMQLLHLRFTTVRKDEKAFKSWLAGMKNVYANITSTPEFKYQRRINEIKRGKNNPWIALFNPNPEQLDEIDLDRAIEVYKERFADAGNFQFVVGGNIDLDTFRPLLEQYVASLPTKNSKESYKNLNLKIKSGQISENVYAGVDEKSLVNIILSGDYTYSRENNSLMQAIASLLTNKMLETLREKMSGVYGANASYLPSAYPEPSFQFNIAFPCKPENAEALAQAALKELEKIKKGDFTDEDLQKIINIRKDDFDKQIKENGYWLSAISAYLENGWSLEGIMKGKAQAEAITREAIIKTANQYLTGKNLIKVVKLPESDEKKD